MTENLFCKREEERCQSLGKGVVRDRIAKEKRVYPLSGSPGAHIRNALQNYLSLLTFSPGISSFGSYGFDNVLGESSLESE